MEPISSQDWERAWQARAAKQMAGHVVRPLANGAGWSFCHPDNGFHAGELVLLGHNSILVHGDLPSVKYTGGHYREPELRLSWLAQSNLDYLAGKVSLGKSEQYVEECAEHWLLREIAEYVAEEDEDRAKRIEGLREALDRLKRGDGEDELRRFLIEDVYDYDSEATEHFGKAVSSDVIWTLAAAKLVHQAVRAAMPVAAAATA